MHISFAFLLTIFLHVVQSEERNKTCVNRAKRRIPENFVENVIFPDFIKKGLHHSLGKPGQVAKSSFYSSILKNIADLVALKKNEFKDNINPDQENVMFQSSEDCKDSSDKEIENDPSMPGFYTFTKMTSEEQKSMPWLDLLSAPFIQSLVKPKAVTSMKKNYPLPNFDKIHSVELTDGDKEINRQDIDEESLNNLVQLFSSFGQGYSKKLQRNDNEVGLTNQPSLNNEVMEEKLASSCFVENKSNYFKTDASGPYNKYIGGQELLGRTNFTNHRFEKDNSSSNFFDDDKRSKPSLVSDQLRNILSLREYKASQWPYGKTSSINIPNLPKDNNNRVDDKVYVENESSVLKNEDKKPIEVLGEINLDPPQKSSNGFISNYNQSKYFNEMIKQDGDSYHRRVLNENPYSSPELYNRSLNSNINLQNYIQSQDALERIRVLNSILNANKLAAPSRLVFNANSGKSSPMVKSFLDPNFVDNKCDINALSKLLNKMNHFEEKSENITTDPPDSEKLTYSNTLPTDSEVNAAVPLDNKVPPPSVAIGESHPPTLPPEPVHPGHERIILPEYEKMDNSLQDATRTVEYSDSTEFSYNTPVTTLIDNVQIPSSEPPPSIGADTLNALHRNMIPVIDFLGQMWNSPNRRNHVPSAAAGKSLATECGGYVIVPLPKSTMLQDLKQLEKTVSIPKDFNDLRASHVVKSSSNTSISGLVTTSNRDLLEKFVLRRLYDSFRGYLAPRRRARRSKGYDIIEDSHTQEASTTPTCPLNSTQLPPTDKWIISSSFG